jgi:hypothetical protein
MVKWVRVLAAGVSECLLFPYRCGAHFDCGIRSKARDLAIRATEVVVRSLPDGCTPWLPFPRTRSTPSHGLACSSNANGLCKADDQDQMEMLC